MSIENVQTQAKSASQAFFEKYAGDRLYRTNPEGTTIIDHAERVKEVLAEFGINQESPLMVAAMMHDASEHMLEKPLPDDAAVTIGGPKLPYKRTFLDDRFQPFIDLYEKNPEFFQKVVKIIGGAYEYELEAESWRRVVGELTEDNLIVNAPTTLERSLRVNEISNQVIIDELLSVLKDAGGQDMDVKELTRLIMDYNKTTLLDAFEKTISPKLRRKNVDINGIISLLLSKNTEKGVDDHYYSLRLPRIGIERMLLAVEEHGVEGLILKSAEVVDNLRHPNTGNRLSTWVDAQEVISFYAPLLDLLGLRDAAMLASNEALDYLNDHDPSLHLAVHSNIEEQNTICQEFAKAPSRITGMNNQELIDMLLSEITVDGKSPLKTSSRIKTLGSMFEKRKPSGDELGFEIVIPNFEASEENDLLLYLESYISQVISLMSAEGYIPGHKFNQENIDPNNDEPDVQITAGSPDKVQKINQIRSVEIDGVNIEFSVEIGPKRKSGYQAVHLNFIHAERNVGVEVKIKTEDWYEDSEKGEHAHIFYKNNFSLDSLLGYIDSQILAYQEMLDATQDTNTERLQELQARLTSLKGVKSKHFTNIRRHLKNLDPMIQSFQQTSLTKQN